MLYKKPKKNFHPIAHDNVADCAMVALTDEPLLCRKKSKKEWKFKCKSWTKQLDNQLLLLPKYSKTVMVKHKFTA